MKTTTAMTAHSAIGVVQAAAMTQSLGSNPSIPWWGQAAIQIALIVLQILSAKVNSESDPNGNPLPASPSSSK